LQARQAHQPGDPLAAHAGPLPQTDPGESGGLRRCLWAVHGMPGSAPSSPNLQSPASREDVSSTHGTRWGRHPACGTSWRSDR
jgi:hypothetical protein